MSYEPTQWKDGDLVTSAKLNKLEQGVANGGGIMVVHANEDMVLDKTWQEIYNGGFGVITGTTSFGIYYLPIIGIHTYTNQFIITTIINGEKGPEIAIFMAQSADDYPIWQDINNNNDNDNDNDDESSGDVVK